LSRQPGLLSVFSAEATGALLRRECQRPLNRLGQFDGKEIAGRIQIILPALIHDTHQGMPRR